MKGTIHGNLFYAVSLAFHHFNPLRPKYSSNHRVVKHPYSVFPFILETKFYIDSKQDEK